MRYQQREPPPIKADLPIFRKRKHVSYDWEKLEAQMRGALRLNDLSADQKTVYQEVLRWYWQAGAGDVLRVGGFAGTGKSTLTALIAKGLEHNNGSGEMRIAFCAYTGKAANVLRQKLNFEGVHTSIEGFPHFGGTIHSLVYEPTIDKNTGAILSWRKRQREEFDYDLVVIDEASMVDNEVLNDIKSLGAPVLAVGDHGQLPPVGGAGSLMEVPDLRLEQIHRQAQGNPIIDLATHVRETGDLPSTWKDTPHVQFISFNKMFDILEPLYDTVELDNLAILTYTNAARQRMNQQARCMRRRMDVPPEPVKGDQFICLRNRQSTLFNGMRGQLETDPKDQGHWYKGTVFFPDDELEVEGSFLKWQIGRETFNSFAEISELTHIPMKSWSEAGLLFDYGYALTVHKAQGSQFKNVFLLYERPRFATTDDMRRWLYSAVTRSTENLYVVVG